MGDIVVIGGGFAGLEAVRILRRNRPALGGRRILLLDVKPTSDFLPVLPDVIGGRVRVEHVRWDLSAYAERLGINFEQGEVVRVDTKTREVFLQNGAVIGFEFLLVTCGSVTNFYGMKEAERRALKLDTAQDASFLANIVTANPGKKIVVVGGGYTGIEIATNLASLLGRRRGARTAQSGQSGRPSVNIVEKEEDLLGPLPGWIKDYCRINLCALRVNVHTGCSLKKVSDQRLTLSNGLFFDDYLLIWAAGVFTPAFVRDMPFEKDGQGRLVVKESLIFAENCFVAGDAASFKHKGRPLRMGVQFSIVQGGVAARNILRLIQGKQTLFRFRPLDLGWIVPLSTRKGCGKILFSRVWGCVGWSFHYMMCIYRSFGLKNKLGIARDAFFKLW